MTGLLQSTTHNPEETVQTHLWENHNISVEKLIYIKLISDCSAIYSCPAEWHGELCDLRSSCQDYCLHGGSCTLQPNGQQSCNCLNAWTGLRCELLSSCTPAFCFNGGTCQQTKNRDMGPDCMWVIFFKSNTFEVIIACYLETGNTWLTIYSYHQ